MQKAMILRQYLKISLEEGGFGILGGTLIGLMLGEIVREQQSTMLNI